MQVIVYRNPQRDKKNRIVYDYTEAAGLSREWAILQLKAENETIAAQKLLDQIASARKTTDIEIKFVPKEFQIR